MRFSLPIAGGSEARAAADAQEVVAVRDARDALAATVYLAVDVVCRQQDAGFFASAAVNNPGEPSPFLPQATSGRCVTADHRHEQFRGTARKKKETAVGVLRNSPLACDSGFRRHTECAGYIRCGR
jgi:hypothetical protein